MKMFDDHLGTFSWLDLCNTVPPWLRALTAYANKLQFLASMGLSQVDSKSVLDLEAEPSHPEPMSRKGSLGSLLALIFDESEQETINFLPFFSSLLASFFFGISALKCKVYFPRSVRWLSIFLKFVGNSACLQSLKKHRNISMFDPIKDSPRSQSFSC